MRDLSEIRLACPVCHLRYISGQIEILGAQGGDILVRCACGCGVVSTFLIATSAKLAPVSVDDVLSAHEFLKTYEGDAVDLFKE